jgi:hypothetical protein
MSFCTSVTKQGKPCKNGLNCHLHCNETETCSICLNPARKTRGVKDLRCGHRFHRKCINEWAVKGGGTCPMCRKPIDESKFKVSITIENTEQNITNTWPLPTFSVSSLLNGLGFDDFSFGMSEIRMDIDTNDDMELFMRDLGIRISDFDSLIFNTE